MKTAIIVGASARACAQSLVRAGIAPVAVDLFGDRDLRAIARTVKCPMEGYPEAIPGIIRNQLSDVGPDVPVVITGAMENHPQVLREIERIRPLMGGSAAAIEKARTWRVLADACEAAGDRLVIAQPRYEADTPAQELARIGRWWVMKPVKSSAGHGMVRFDVSQGVPERKAGQEAYFQPWVDDVTAHAASAQFRVVNGIAELVGTTEQIIGDESFGARYATQYVGNVAYAMPVPEGGLERVGREIVTRTGLAGVFGIDYMQEAGGVCRLLEVNPRYTSGMDAVEMSAQRGIFSEEKAGRQTRVWGKAIVYAKQGCRVPDLWEHIARESVADVPEPGDEVPAGRPICTVMGYAEHPQGCLEHLRALARRVYTLCEP